MSGTSSFDASSLPQGRYDELKALIVGYYGIYLAGGDGFGPYVVAHEGFLPDELVRELLELCGEQAEVQSA